MEILQAVENYIRYRIDSFLKFKALKFLDIFFQQWEI